MLIFLTCYIIKCWSEGYVSKVLKQRPGSSYCLHRVIVKMRCQQCCLGPLCIYTYMWWEWWRGGQHEMEEGKDGRKGARKVKRSNWEDGWWQSNEETAQTHTCMHAVTQTGIRAQVHTLTRQQRIHTSQTAALGYVSKEHVFKQAFTQTCRTDIQRNQEKRWKGDCYSSKKMEDDKKGWGKGQRKVQENWEKKLNEEKPTKEILSVCYTRACI